MSELKLLGDSLSPEAIKTINNEFFIDVNSLPVIGRGQYGIALKLSEWSVLKITSQISEIQSISWILKYGFGAHPGCITYISDDVLFAGNYTYAYRTELVASTNYRQPELFNLVDYYHVDDQLQEISIASLNASDVYMKTDDWMSAAKHFSAELTNITFDPLLENIVKFAIDTANSGSLFTDYKLDNAGIRIDPKTQPLRPDAGLVIFDLMPLVEGY